MKKREIFKFPIYFMKEVFTKAYPLHMAQGMRAMRGIVMNCDCVIEIRDARVPLSSSNINFADLYAKKPKILVMNKIDIANKELTENICKTKLTKSYNHIIFGNCKAQHSRSFTKIILRLKEMFKEIDKIKDEKKIGKGYDITKERKYKVLVCGVPNVGKSSFINSARRHYMSKGGKPSRVGKVPGVTRSVLHPIIISQRPFVKILDTPGVVPPTVHDPIVGIKLALTGSFPDHKIGEEVIADYLLYALNQQDNTSYLEFCGLEEPTDDFDYVIESIAKEKGYYRSRDGIPDYRMCSIQFIAAYRNGKFGRLTLDGI